MNRPPFDFAVPDYPLAPATLYNVGGPARLALLPRTVEEACRAHSWMRDQAGPRLVLGRGSNVLISDRGFDGIVLSTTGLKAVEPLGGHRYRVESGCDLGTLVREVIVPNNYGATGALTGIPGSVGGALYMNAGTVNGATCDYVEAVDLVTREGRRSVTLAPDMYGYRGQGFCGREDLILGAVFRFEKVAEDQRAVYDRYMARRRERQPQGACCGSVFKNPADDHAGRLIEACGLKGTRRGGAVISTVHANFIMNERDATFDDILGLVMLCENTVRDRFGIQLEREVVVIGPRAGPAREDHG